MIPTRFLERFELSKYLAVIDIETEGQTQNARIATVGGVMINLESLSVVSTFYECVTRHQAGRVSDESTLAFWERQKEENPRAWAEIYDNDDRLTLKETLDKLAAWLMEGESEGRHVQVMGNGPEFDNAILCHAFAQFGLSAPWRYTANQSLRTAVLLCELLHGINPRHTIRPNEYPHHALFDAIHEAEAFIHALRILSGISPAADYRITELEQLLEEQTPDACLTD